MVDYLFSTLSVPGVADTTVRAGAINDFGQIAGTFGAGSSAQAFVLTAGHVATTPEPQHPFGFAVSGLNNLDQLAGSGTDIGGGSFAQRFHPLSGRFDAPTALISPFEGSGVSGGLNDRGQLAGADLFASPGGYAGAVAWVEKGGAFTELPQLGNFTEATGINDRGQVVGWFSNMSGLSTEGPDTTRQGFIDTNGTITTINDPAGFMTTPTAINNGGEVAGDFTAVTYPLNPPGYVVEEGFVDVGGQFTTVAVPGATATSVTGINDFGVVVGNYASASGGGAFVAVPENADLAKVGPGALGFAARPGFLRGQAG